MSFFPGRASAFHSARTVFARTALVTAGVVGSFSTVMLGVGILAIIEGLAARDRLSPRQLADPPRRTGIFGAEKPGEPIELALLGDSLAVGVGATDPDLTLGVLLADGLSDEAQRPVHLHNVAVTGSESKDLQEQVNVLLAHDAPLEVVVIIVGGNEVIRLQRVSTVITALAEAVRYLRHRGCHVVVATCPDMGTISTFRQPLRLLAHWMSRILATAQTIVVLRAGGRTVSLADTLGPLFWRESSIMFSADRLHPSSQGYSRAAKVLLPSVCAAAGYWTGKDVRVPHRVYRKDLHSRRLAWIAFRATRHAGTETHSGHSRGGRLIESGSRRLLRAYERIQRPPTDVR